jgi:hypothetical protein
MARILVGRSGSGARSSEQSSLPGTKSSWQSTASRLRAQYARPEQTSL